MESEVKAVTISEKRYVCRRCGKQHREGNECAVVLQNWSCYSCGKVGHTSTVCRGQSTRMSWRGRGIKNRGQQGYVQNPSRNNRYINEVTEEKESETAEVVKILQ